MAQLKFVGKVSKKRKASRKSICHIYKEAPLSFAKCRETVETLKGLERKTGKKSPGGLLPQDLPCTFPPALGRGLRKVLSLE